MFFAFRRDGDTREGVYYTDPEGGDPIPCHMVIPIPEDDHHPPSKEHPEVQKYLGKGFTYLGVVGEYSHGFLETLDTCVDFKPRKGTFTYFDWLKKR